MGFFSLNSSQWELSEVLQQIFSISYRFRDIRGRKCNLWGRIKYSFFIQFWWDFFHWISFNESFQICSSRFFPSLTLFEIQGAQKDKNVTFKATSKFYFSFNFDGIFFIELLSISAFRGIITDFFYLLPFSRYKGPQHTIFSGM